MKNILVPVGSSKNAVSHLQYAVDFANAFKAKLFVVQTYNVFTKAGTMIKVDQILERESYNFINGLVEQIDTKNVEVITKVLKGDLLDALDLVCKAADIDLIIIDPKTTSEDETLYLGSTSGKIVKQTQVPTLIVPKGYKFKPISHILMAVKSAVIKKEGVLKPLMDIKKKFSTIVDLLLVKTPYYNEGDFELKEELSTLVRNVTKTENATTFQGVLEHFREHDPDMLCVVRRKRGFFMKLWEKSTILKKDFHSSLPVLILSGMK